MGNKSSKDRVKCEVKGCEKSSCEDITICKNHKCQYYDCINLALIHDYCPEHKCKKCNNKIKLKRGAISSDMKTNDYCSEHYCSNDFCGKCKIDGSEYCVNHTCSSIGCFNSVDRYARFGENYCRVHKCKYYGCNKHIPNGICCEKHACKIPDCISTQYNLKKDKMCDYHFQLS